MNHNERIIKLLKRKGILRPRDVEAIGIPSIYLSRLYQDGKIERVGRGLYTLPDKPISEHTSLIEVAKRVPQSVICLLSALQFHQLTTQLPFEIWIAIEGTSRKPNIDYPSLHVMRFSGVAFHYGVEIYHFDSVPVQIYTVAKTIADCFKFRNKIGLDVALEALRQTIHEKRATIDSIWQASKVCRVSNVIKPYLEAII